VIERDGYRYAYHIITGTEALFDLRADPACRQNLASQIPEQTKKLRAILTAEQVESIVAYLVTLK